RRGAPASKKNASLVKTLLHGSVVGTLTLYEDRVGHVGKLARAVINELYFWRCVHWVVPVDVNYLPTSVLVVQVKCYLADTYLLNGFVYENHRNERCKVFLSEAGNEAHKVAQISGHKDEQYKS